MKILLTDIFFRKSFDVINILKAHYPIGDFIFTIPSDSRSNRFKLKHFHETRDFEILTHENFDKELLNISKKYSTEEIIYLPIEESTTFNFLKFITDNNELNFKYLLPSLSNFQLSRHKEQLNLFCEEKSISCPKHISESVLKNKDFKFPIINTITKKAGAKLIYSSVKDKKIFVPKVVWSNGVGTYPIVDDTGKYGLTQFSYGIKDEPKNLKYIQKALNNPQFIKLMNYVKFTDNKYNYKIIGSFKKDFYKQYLSDEPKTPSTTYSPNDPVKSSKTSTD